MEIQQARTYGMQQKHFSKREVHAVQTQIKTRLLCLEELEKEQTEPKLEKKGYMLSWHNRYYIKSFFTREGTEVPGWGLQRNLLSLFQGRFYTTEHQPY